MPSKFLFYPFKAGQEVTLKKTHPCGGKKWRVLSVGADIHMKCMTCGRVVILKRKELETKCIAVQDGEDTLSVL